MTSFAFICGCLPLWFASGSGAVARRVLGSTVIGGMLAASGIAIFFIPVTFYVVERLSSRGHVTPKAPQPEAQAAPAAALPS
jgi:HAE1 family hydrophobic/amphiphilic exporter-1